VPLQLWRALHPPETAHSVTGSCAKAPGLDAQLPDIAAVIEQMRH
jgi:hypothetical protein